MEISKKEMVLDKNWKQRYSHSIPDTAPIRYYTIVPVDTSRATDETFDEHSYGFGEVVLTNIPDGPAVDTIYENHVMLQGTGLICRKGNYDWWDDYVQVRYKNKLFWTIRESLVKEHLYKEWDPKEPEMYSGAYTKRHYTTFLDCPDAHVNDESPFDRLY
jgi:hypothetical protein